MNKYNEKIAKKDEPRYSTHNINNNNNNKINE